MENAVTGQVSRSAADFYEAFFVPALFQDWTGPILDKAGVASGQKVLDVGCGTGILARDAFKRVQPGGSVIGLDRNDGMIETAARTEPGIAWQQAPAETLPYDDASFDAVLSQFALMFFEDRVAALQEMWRVLKPGGRLTVAVWDSLDNTPGYAAMTGLLQRLFGDKIADELRTPYMLGDKPALRSLFEQAGITDPVIETQDGTARFPSIEAWVDMDVKGWTLGDLIDDAQYQLLLTEAQESIKPFVQSDGTVAFRSPAHIVTATQSGNS